MVTSAAAGWAICERIRQDSARLAEAVRRADVLLGWADPRWILEGNVKMFLCGSAGLDAYVGHGLDAKQGLRCCSATGTMSIPIAEHCIALMLALVREINVMLRQQAEHRWERRLDVCEVMGTKGCVVGLGAAGTELARRLTVLGMNVCGVRRDAKRGHPLVREVYAPSQLQTAVRDADHVFCLVPGGRETRHLFRAETFSSMKRGSYFYSASRGSATDEDALIEALRRGHLGGAGLDVFAHEPLPQDRPLWDMPNVIVSPHSAGFSEHLSRRLAELFSENLRNLREGRPLRNEVDLRQLH